MKRFCIIDDGKKEQEDIIIYVSENVERNTLLYIADCWADFVTKDLGLEPGDLMMVLPW